MTFEINDAVTVRHNDEDLQGIIATAVIDGKIGIRLTGDSVGKGDGTGDPHFAAPPNSALFVAPSAVTVRSLTRLEQLRLKRELAKLPLAAAAANRTPPHAAAPPAAAPAATSTTPAPAAAASTPPRPAASTTPERTPSKIPSTKKTPLKVITKSEDSSSPSDRATRLEELRKRREALQAKSPAVASATTPARSPAVAPAELEALRSQVATAQQIETQLRAQIVTLEQGQAELQRQVEQAQTQMQTKETKPDDDKKKDDDKRDKTIRQLQTEQATLLERLQTAELARDQATTEATRLRDSASTVSSSVATYKELAKCQAELGAAQRKIDQFGSERQELENAIEDLTLDKEQLEQEREALRDENEELKLDVETAHLQMDEVRMELEDAQTAVASRLTPDAAADGGDNDDQLNAEDKAAALAHQNSRLREALLRLREQSAVEKMELTRQVRVAEKEAQQGQELVDEVTTLRESTAILEEQVADLKEMLDQASAFESMVEDLSDRVLSMEEDNVQLQTTIREMEEAAELTAEMEEVQADELKALTRDLDGRDAIIRNLEEAIKIQRRREEDFQRTVGNYRNTVETLKLEKQALLHLQEGDKGEKSDIISASQKALAKAAQMVAETAAARKRDALAALDKVDRQTYSHMSSRFESLLPQASVSLELSAIKGELLASRVVSMAAQSLSAITLSFQNAIHPVEAIDDVASEQSALSLSDDTKADVAAIFHSSDFALEIVETSSGLLRFLAAGQWPDVISSEASAELGSILIHSLGETAAVMGTVLASLKEEGNLTPERANIGHLQQSRRSTLQKIEEDLKRDAEPILSPDWDAPGMNILRDVTIAKTSFLGSAASLSTVLNAHGSGATSLHKSYGLVEQCSAQLVSGSQRLANIDVTNDALLSQVRPLVELAKKESLELAAKVKAKLLESDEGDCLSAAESACRAAVKLTSFLRAANLKPVDEDHFHALSTESIDPWNRVSSLARSVRAINGDEDEVNHLTRARNVEHQLTMALENEPKLDLAENKISSLEKTLATRSKEIAMQNARMVELERVMAKSNVSAARMSGDVASSAEFKAVQEENRVLMEAMDVMQRQVEEYESEIRSLKDFKTPRRGQQGSRRVPTPSRDLTSPGANTKEDTAATNSLEATLFRPALQEALRESWRWKAAAMSNDLASLAPLPTASLATVAAEEATELQNALASLRRQRASVKLVDLTHPTKSARQQLQETRRSCWEASCDLETTLIRLRGQLPTRAI